MLPEERDGFEIAPKSTPLKLQTQVSFDSTVPLPAPLPGFSKSDIKTIHHGMPA
jgi:hypothetical protein